MKQQSQARATRKHVILFLAANPHDTGRLALDREARSIHVELKRSGYRDRFDFVTRWAAEPLDLLRELRELKPTIVHFSGHGARPIAATDLARGRAVVATAPSEGELGGVVFDSANGRSQMVAPEAIAQTFGALGAQVRLVVLNACYTVLIAEALLSHVDCVVGIGGAIHDDAARSFAIGFYGGLGEHESVAAAFEQGKAAINLDGLFDAEQPQLKVRDGFGAAQLILAAVPPLALVDMPCPYPGMRPFAADDADSFHGRDSEIAELIGRLRAGEREIFVIGPSGSGKSSLVSAGVLPRLVRGVAGLGQFVVRELRPGEQPTERLGQVLEMPVAEPLVIADRVDGLLAHRGPVASLLIVVDQLEELFTLASADERARFLDALGALRAERRCVVVFTLRADFFGAFMESALWAERRGQLSRVEVSPLRDEALREAIAAPAQAVGVAVESELIERLVADAASEAGILPLLQETMVQLWDVRVDQTLTLAAYRVLGDGERSGLAVALARRADTTVRRFTPAQAAIARRILLRLVVFGEGRSDTRRQQPQSKLCASAEETGVLQQMIDDRLLTAGEENSGEPQIDLAHEIMIAAWPTLAGWIQSHRVDEQRRRQLEAKADEWVKSGRGQSRLLDVDELLEVHDWLDDEKARDLGVSEDVHSFLARSEAALAARVAEAESRRRSWRRWVAVALVALTGAVVVASALAVIAGRRSRDLQLQLARNYVSQGHEQLMQDHLAQAAPFLVAAREAGINDVSLRLLFQWAAHGVPLMRFDFDKSATHIAWSPDGRKLVTANSDHKVRVWDAVTWQAVIPPLTNQSGGAWSPDGRWLATTGGDKTVRVWDLTTGQAVTSPLADQREEAWSPDGRWLATLSDDKTVRVWDLTTGQAVAPAIALQDGITSVAWSPDGRRLATASFDHTARVWDVVRGQEVTPPLAHQRTVWAVAWSPDGRRIATGSDDETATAQVWDALSGQAVTPPLMHRGWVRSIAWSADGRRVATASSDHTARVWDAVTGNAVTPPLTHHDKVTAVAWSPDGRWVATASEDKTARVWDAVTGNAVTPPLAHREYVHAVAWSPDGQRVATESGEQTAQVWDAGIGQVVTPPLTHHGKVTAVAWSPDGRWVATASFDKTARVWDAVTGQVVTPPLAHQGWVTSVAWSPDGRRVATASEDKTARVWDAVTGNAVTPPLAHQGWVTSVAWSPDGQRLATASSDGITRMWDAASGQAMTPPLKHNSQGTAVAWVTAVAWSPDGRRVAMATDAHTARVWDAVTGQAVTPPLEHQRWVKTVAWSPDGRQVVTGSGDNTARVWDAISGQAVTPPLVHQAEVTVVAWSPDGRRVATAGDKTARIWDAISGQAVTPPLEHQGWVTSVAWSPDGQRLATAGDKTARVWDTISGQALTPPLMHQAEVIAVAWSPDGRRLATASDDKTARVWDLSGDTGTLSDWRATLERCDYRLNDIGILVSRYHVRWNSATALERDR